MKSQLIWLRNFLFDSDRKSFLTIIRELKILKNIYISNSDIIHYFYCLMYKKNAGNLVDYMPRQAYIKIIKEYYRVNGQHMILQDKNLFNNLLSSMKIPVSSKVAEVKKGVLYVNNNIVEGDLLKNILSLLEDDIALFIKQVDSEGGKGVFKVDKGTKKSSVVLNNNCDYIIEKEIQQHHDLIAINPYCLNTLRVITVYKNDGVLIPDCFFRMGTGKSVVDNGSSGGVFIHYDIHNNIIDKVAYKLPESGGMSYYEHPTTKVKFEGMKLPYPEKVIELVTNAAMVFKDKELIGWDIAYTPNGPIILEANDNPHLVMMQISCKGLMSNVVYKDIFSKYMFNVYERK